MTKAAYGKGVHKCRKCGNRAPFDKDEGVYRCITCGHEMRELRQLYKFIDANKKEILRDIRVIGVDKTRVKWGIPLSWWRHVRERWGIYKIWWGPGMPFPSNDGLPKLPAWRHSWTPEFKMLWLETYKVLVESRKEGEFASDLRGESGWNYGRSRDTSSV